MNNKPYLSGFQPLNLHQINNHNNHNNHNDHKFFTITNNNKYITNHNTKIIPKNNIHTNHNNHFNNSSYCNHNNHAIHNNFFSPSTFPYPLPTNILPFFSHDLSVSLNQKDILYKHFLKSLNNGEASNNVDTFTSDSNKRKSSSRESSAALKAWLLGHRDNPYPTKSEKVMLALLTRMTLTQVSTWFANARRRLKKEKALRSCCSGDVGGMGAVVVDSKASKEMVLDSGGDNSDDEDGDDKEESNEAGRNVDFDMLREYHRQLLPRLHHPHQLNPSDIYESKSLIFNSNFNNNHDYNTTFRSTVSLVSSSSSSTSTANFQKEKISKSAEEMSSGVPGGIWSIKDIIGK